MYLCTHNLIMIFTWWSKGNEVYTINLKVYHQKTCIYVLTGIRNVWESGLQFNFAYVKPYAVGGDFSLRVKHLESYIRVNIRCCVVLTRCLMMLHSGAFDLLGVTEEPFRTYKQHCQNGLLQQPVKLSSVFSLDRDDKNLLNHSMIEARTWMDLVRDCSIAKWFHTRKTTATRLFTGMHSLLYGPHLGNLFIVIL